MSAFCLLPVRPQDRCYLIMKAEHPVTKVTYFVIDKCLPFRASIRCSHFQSFSDALAHILEYKLRFWIILTNYLDDFLFIAYTRSMYNEAMECFFVICGKIQCPFSPKETECVTQYIVFLGMLMNGRTLTLSVPDEKRQKAIKLLNWVIKKKKVTVHIVQKLTGVLNFLTRAIIPGWTFTRNMYNKLKIKDKEGKPLKQYHHIMVDSFFRRDCMIWLQFLKDTRNQALCHPFIDVSSFEYATELCFYTDASLNLLYGMGGIFGNSWIVGPWGQEFITKQKPSIEFLELFMLCAGVMIWADRLVNNRYIIYCDNQAVISMVNNLTLTCNQCMKLIRMLTLNNMRYHRRIFVRYVWSEQNILADALSRMNFSKFWKNAPKSMNKLPDSVDQSIWPVDKVWFYDSL